MLSDVITMADKTSDIDKSICIVWRRVEPSPQTIVNKTVHNEVDKTAVNEFVSDYYKIKGA